MQSSNLPRSPRVVNRSVLSRGTVTRGIAVLALLALVAACSSASAPAFSGVGVSGTASDGTAQAAGPATLPEAIAAPSAAASAAPAFAAAGGSGGSAAVSLVDTPYIVRTGSLTIEVPVVDDALLRARTAIVGLGGYISGSEESNSGDRSMASVTYRIPADRWEAALDALRGIATKVDSLRTDSSEVTGQVLDLGARIDNLRVTETALQAVMTKATKIQDILDVQNQLTAVQGQIEELTTEQNHLKDQAAMSSLTVLFQAPPPAAVRETSKGWDPGAQFDRAAAQLLGLGQALATIGIWSAVVGLPILLGLLLALLLLVVLARRIPWRPSRPAGPSAPSGPSPQTGAV